MLKESEPGELICVSCWLGVSQTSALLTLPGGALERERNPEEESDPAPAILVKFVFLFHFDEFVLFLFYFVSCHHSYSFCVFSFNILFHRAVSVVGLV